MRTKMMGIGALACLILGAFGYVIGEPLKHHHSRAIAIAVFFVSTALVILGGYLKCRYEDLQVKVA